MERAPRKYSPIEIKEFQDQMNREYDRLEQTMPSEAPTEPHRPLTEIVREAKEVNGKR